MTAPWDELAFESLVLLYLVREFRPNLCVPFSESSGIVYLTDEWLRSGQMVWYYCPQGGQDVVDQGRIEVEPDFNRALFDCLGSNARFVAFLLRIRKSLGCPLDIPEHVNLILIDKKNGTAERFDPIGYQRRARMRGLDDNLKDIFARMQFRYLSPSSFCPALSVQSRTSAQFQALGGGCSAWNFWWLITRLRNPDENPRILIRQAMSEVEKSGTAPNQFDKFIIDFSQWLVRQASTILQRYDFQTHETGINWVGSQERLALPVLEFLTTPGAVLVGRASLTNLLELAQIYEVVPSTNRLAVRLAGSGTVLEFPFSYATVGIVNRDLFQAYLQSYAQAAARS